MKEKLKGPEIEGVSIAAVYEEGIDNTMVYNVYLINETDDFLEHVMITSKGYVVNEKTAERIETNTLRRHVEIIVPDSVEKIEPIMEEVMGLNNEYWVSFWIEDTLYDKKYIFLPESISEENFMKVPLINKKGVLIG